MHVQHIHNSPGCGSPTGIPLVSCGISLAMAAGLAACSAGTEPSSAVERARLAGEQALPNVLVIYTDDVGYGDVGVYGGLIPTPEIDRLAEEGLLFTNAYATSATCTPSRYSLLTGEYAWRQPGTGVVPGNAPAIIAEGRDTWPAVMQRGGYRTAVIGKWHLGLGGPEGPDFNGKVAPGPLEVGFDYSWIIPSTNDRVPTVYMEGHYVVNLDPDDPIEISYRENISDRPTGREHPELLKMMFSHGHDMTITNGISRIGYMQGGESALWRDEDIADVLVDKAIAFIDHGGGQTDKPFFMYYAPVDIHVPRIVHERFEGITPFGPRGDMMVQLDWQVGALMQALEERGMADNTIIVFSSDNGPVLDDGYVDYAEELTGDHDPFAGFRGGKYSALEAGTRIPFLVWWPGVIDPGTTSPALFSQIDLMASFAAYLSQDYDTSRAPDTQNQWEALLGDDHQGREGLVQQAIQNVLTYVSGDGYKFIPASRGPAFVPWGTGIETGFLNEEQLYDLTNDRAESVNLASERPELLETMRTRLTEIREQ